VKYYVIRGDQIVSMLDCDAGDVIVLPRLGGGDAMSLLNERHAQNLVSNLGLTASEALAALGIGDLRTGAVSAIVLDRLPSNADFAGATYQLVRVAGFGLWQCVGQIEDLLELHQRLWAREPVGTFGLLAAVQEFGVSFHASAVRAHTGMTVAQASERRDRIASYLEAQGYEDTTTLRKAADEHEQILGIVQALGYTEQQPWNAMVAV